MHWRACRAIFLVNHKPTKGPLRRLACAAIASATGDPSSTNPHPGIPTPKRHNPQQPKPEIPRAGAHEERTQKAWCSKVNY